MTRPEPDLVLRPATAADLPDVAEVHLRSRHAAHPRMPHPVHADADVRAWVEGWDLTAAEVWVAVRGDDVVGYARFTRTWLDDLYVHPAHQDAGIGGALLDLVKAQRRDGFSLWVFETNQPARDFYAHRGLVEVEHTDGSENEEKAADVRMAWGPGGR